ncbi:tyrosine-type recombinase/integrase [Shimia sediminis]|uniref:tyrosine-type recombinase/integrase n=1 Tax=Shimia sediminis TaxID=2497945 RepID=UPI000F8D4DC8|nr:tyrosine-type recombinase/integrase [Shimia sediminis]
MKNRRKYLYSDTDRHGNRRWYFKPPGWTRKTRMAQAEGTAAFHTEYETLLEKWRSGDVPEDRKKVAKDSVEMMLRQYQASAAFAALAPSTREQRSNFYIRFCRKHGAIGRDDLTPADLAKVRDAFGDRRFAARNFVKAMRRAYAWASSPEVGLATGNPAAQVSLPSGQTDGHTRWSLDHVLKFKNFYPKGHRARIALAILLFTVQRISDVRVMGRAQVRDGFIKVKHYKTGNEIEIPLLSILRDELGDRYKEMIWWQSELGRPYSIKSASMRFSDFAKDAGLPSGYTAHGLRKCVPTILAEMGMSEDVIMSVLGDKSADAARVYIQDANRKALAARGLRAAETELAKIWNKKSGKLS